MKELIWGGTGCFKTCNYVKPDITFDFLHCENTYAGVMMSSPDRVAQDNDYHIKCHEEKIAKLFRREPHIILKSYQKDYPNVLQMRVCMAGLVKDWDKCLGVIWYDDGSKDIRESLNDIIDQVDWSKARDFDY